MWGYRLCLRCGKIEILGDVDTLEKETERVFVHWQATSVDDKDGSVLAGRTEDMFMSLEDPAWCEDCWEEFRKEER